tara:strand:- start:80 stop:292 length:213 start_codon:yes stop_codon:yes gene_type:complete
MKFALTMIICSIVYQECTDPHQMPQGYDTFKDCVVGGHEEAIKKMADFKTIDVNNNMIHIKFACIRSVSS